MSDWYCPDAVRAGFDIVSSGQSVVLGTAVVLGLAAVVLYRWWTHRRRKGIGWQVDHGSVFPPEEEENG